MHVIPVVDLKGGQVVRAQRGDRANYRPIQTPLSRTAKPLDVVAGLLSLHPFKRLYVADLDAIEGVGDAGAIIQNIVDAFPQLELWIDNGCSEAAAASAFLARWPKASLVLGSESQKSDELLRGLRNHPRVILSLDFRDELFLGPPVLVADETLWPDRLIVMTLSRVGSSAGPDLDRFRQIKAHSGGREVYMAGGLRGAGDLGAATAAGADGFLVASALHGQKLRAQDLSALAGGC